MRNRFKGLDLIDRVPDELWIEVRDIVQETGSKTIPMEKKCTKAKWLSVEALQTAVKREAKSIHHDYLGREDLFYTVLLCILATLLNIFCFC